MRSEYVLLGVFPDMVSVYPVEMVYLRSKWNHGYVRLAVVDTLPIEGVDVVIANDIVKGETICYPIVGNVDDNDELVESTVDTAESPMCVIIGLK